MYNLLRKMLRDAQVNNDIERKDFCRSILSLISEHQVANKLDRGPCDDDVVTKVVGKYKKSLEKALDAFRKGGQTTGELFDQYNAEITFCEAFLPRSISDEDLEKQVKQKLEEFKITELNKSMKLIGIIIKDNPSGTVDGKRIKEIIKKTLET